jgi:hypothetical protein
VLRHAAICLCSQTPAVRCTFLRTSLSHLQLQRTGTLIRDLDPHSFEQATFLSADHPFSPDWFSFSEREQRLLTEELGELQRKLPYWAARRVLPGAAFDDIYGPPPPTSPSSLPPLQAPTTACIWACDSEAGHAVCFNLQDDDDWFRHVPFCLLTHAAHFGM